MAINTKKPMVKETVGALYYTFNTPDDSGNFTTTYEANVTKSNVVKNIGTTENSEVAVVRASGQDYTTVNQNESIEMAVEVVAFDPEDLAKMRGDIIGTAGLNRSGRTAVRPFFAFGKVVKKL